MKTSKTQVFVMITEIIWRTFWRNKWRSVFDVVKDSSYLVCVHCIQANSNPRATLKIQFLTDYLLLYVVWKKTIRQHVNLFLSHTPQKQHFRPFSVPLLEATLQFNFMLLLLSLPGENHFRDRKNAKHCISLSFLTFPACF